MRYRHIREFVEKLEQDKENQQSTALAKSAIDRSQRSSQSATVKPQITMTPQLERAIYDCIPSQTDEGTERYIFNQILGQITDVDKFMKLNHSDIRHNISSHFVASKTSSVDGDSVQQSIKSARDSHDGEETDREIENGYLKRSGAVIQDNIYQVTMSTIDDTGRSHISQEKLDAVSKNEGKRYNASKFDSVIYERYRTQQFVVVLIENLDESSTYLIILIDLTTGKIYCGRRYANLVNVVSDTGAISSRAIRRKIVYNENSSAQRELFEVCLQKIAQFQEYVIERNIVGLFDMLKIAHNHGEREHSRINKIGRERREE